MHLFAAIVGVSVSFGATGSSKPCEFTECPHGQFCGVRGNDSEYCVFRQLQHAVTCDQVRCEGSMTCLEGDTLYCFEDSWVNWHEPTCSEVTCAPGQMCVREYKRDRAEPYLGTPVCVLNPHETPILPKRRCLDRTMVNGRTWILPDHVKCIFPSAAKKKLHCELMQHETCEFFAFSRDSCETNGTHLPAADVDSMYYPDARTGKEACCYCGGGTPLFVQPPTCNSSAEDNFVLNGYGSAYTCAKFFQVGFKDPRTLDMVYPNCLAFGELPGFANGKKYTANEACCACQMAKF